MLHGSQRMTVIGHWSSIHSIPHCISIEVWGFQGSIQKGNRLNAEEGTSFGGKTCHRGFHTDTKMILNKRR